MAAAKRGSREGAAISGALAVRVARGRDAPHFFVAHPAGEGRCRRPGCNLPREAKIHLPPPPRDFG